MQHNGPAILRTHCAVFGRREKQVRKISTSIISPCAQYEHALHIYFTEPRKRRGAYIELPPDNIRWAEIVVNGAVVWDSRSEIACDMDKWNAVADKHANRFDCLKRIHDAKGYAVIVEPYPGSDLAMACLMQSDLKGTHAIVVEAQEHGWRAIWLMPCTAREEDERAAEQLVTLLAGEWPGTAFHANGDAVLVSIRERERIVATGLLSENEAMQAAGLMNDWLTDNWTAPKFAMAPAVSVSAPYQSGETVQPARKKTTQRCLFADLES